QHGFEAYFGEKVVCRIILWPLAEKAIAEKMYDKIRQSDEEFLRAARQQHTDHLAAHEGMLDQPVGRFTTGNEAFERAAFSLQPGEISALIETPQGVVVIKCEKRQPADTSKSLNDPQVRQVLEKEIFEKKTAMEIPKVFEELRKQANVKKIFD